MSTLQLPGLLLRDGIFVLVGTVLFGAVGFAVDQFRPIPLGWERGPSDARLARATGQPWSSTTPTPTVESLAEAAARHGGSTKFVDAREPEFFELGHIAGAVNLPRSTFADAYAAFRQNTPPATSLIIYCSDASCPDSTVVAQALIRLGYSDVSVFEEGWEAWSAAALPTEP